MTTRDTIYLGTLLHDIGKFRWRAQPLARGEHHEKLGEYFIREHLGRCIAIQDKIEEIINAANRISPKIKLADETAALEREKQFSRQTRRPLISIFSRVHIGKGEMPSGVFYLKPTALSANFPFPQHVPGTTVEQWAPDETEMIRLHQEYWEAFLNEIDVLNHIEDTEAFTDSLYFLLEKYTSTVSSASFLTYPDIPLFDHSRVVAALTICLEDTDSPDEECLLIQGDISGIQKFIYQDIQHVEDIAKRLRGRSLFVTLLCDTIAEYLIREFTLYRANLLFSTGGHFMILAPNSSHVRTKLKESERLINISLAEDFGNQLQVVLASVKCSSREMMENFYEVRQRLQEEVAKAKYQKNFSILNHLIGRGNDKAMLDLGDIEVKIGNDLPKSDTLIQIVADETISNATVSFPRFNTYWLLKKADMLQLNEDIPEKTQKIMIYCIGDTNIKQYTNLLTSKKPVGVGFKYIGRHVPLYNDRIKEFDELAKEESPGYPLLGIVRMDVDDLGAIFKLGLKEKKEDEKKYTISRFAALSRQLNLFFGSYMNYLAECHKIYLGYSGGDDLFAVGSWVKIINFIKEVRTKFGELVCQNPNFGISCGVIFTKPSYPINKGAIEAGEEEERAKTANQSKKDRVSIFGRQVTWRELEAQIALAEGLYEHVIDAENVSNGKLDRSFIHTLLAMTQKAFDREGKFIVKNVARMAYHFARRDAQASSVQSVEVDVAMMTEQRLKEKKREMNVLLARYLLESDPKEQRRRWWNFVIPVSYVLYKTRSIK